MFSDCLWIFEQIRAMEVAKKPGVIINLGSASGLYPMLIDPIYSAAKGASLASVPRFVWCIIVIIHNKCFIYVPIHITDSFNLFSWCGYVYKIPWFLQA